jgi:hypothetical protein
MLSSALLFVSLAWAGMPEDLTGRWTLDKAASESIDALLKTIGANFFERTAAANLSVTQDISVEGQELVIVVDSTFLDSSERLALDGSPQPRTSKRGEPVVVRTHVDGEALVTSSEITTEGGLLLFEIRRVVEDGGATMRQTLRLTATTGSIQTADRIFRREGS